MKVACPTCQKESEWNSDNSFRPFCCERCKLIDLGEWANESKTIPGQPSFEAAESIEDLGGDPGIAPEDRLH
ncbi:DNA gyrase inhibitor YacG [Gammaproteobacteria bacterium 45_16_T64]|nr:DNA gyrase inhibitor YacG [Gammaproteobacteria bacterium 45_16_T64]